MNRKPHIVMIIPKGEAVRNFLYSDVLKLLSRDARVSLLSVVEDESIMGRFRSFVEQIIPLKYYRENYFVSHFRYLIHTAHYRWLWSEAAKYQWEWRDAMASKGIARFKRYLWKGFIRLLANQPTIEALSALEYHLAYMLRPNDDFINLFKTIRPDLVFNCSHVHGPAGDLPTRTAYKIGIPTVGFIFSWDNLTTRSRIFAPYDYYLVWNEQMRNQLLDIYPNIQSEHVFITGTPQFDFHFKPEFWLDKDELCRRIGVDPQRPFVLYTTGMAHHFPQEHRFVESVANILQDINIIPKHQLVVRTYAKDTSPQMKALAEKGLPNVVFSPVFWDEKWFTPLYEDLPLYSSLLRYTSVGINVASTVSLELLMHDKPVINIGFNPPGSNLPHYERYIRHIEFDHYRPVAESGAVMVAKSENDMQTMLTRGLNGSQADSKKRRCFIKNMFGDTLDGNSGKRIAEKLLMLAKATQRLR